MHLTFLGAAQEVTGSCFLLETSSAKVLVDCGMFQGTRSSEEANGAPFPFDPTRVNAVLCTHAHLDHNGRVPKLVHEGFRGKVYATEPTRDLLRLMWSDAVEIMRGRHERDRDPMLYHEVDVARAHDQVHGCGYGEWIEVAQEIRARFHDAGHIFGSAWIEIECRGKRIVFSGDLGNDDVPILRDTEPLEEVDELVVESTYGDRTHESGAERVAALRKVVSEAIGRGGALMIPAFSIERTQEILYEMDLIFEHNFAPTSPDPSSGRMGSVTPPARGGDRGGGSIARVPIFLDSPLAIRATEVYKKYPQYYDAEAAKYFKDGDDFFKFPGLTLTMSVPASKAINAAPNPKIIIAGSGMLNGGRIMHHLVRYLSDPQSTLLLVSYQAEGTIGRRILSGSKQITMHGTRIEVKAHIEYIGAYSAHADSDKVVRWISSAGRRPSRVFCVHGDPPASRELATRISSELGIQARAPKFGEKVEL